MGIQTEDYCTLISSIASIQLKGVVEKWQIFEEFQAWIVMTSVAALYHAPVGFLAGAVTRIQLQVGVNTRHAPVASTVGATHAHAQRVQQLVGLAGAHASVVLVAHVQLAKPDLENNIYIYYLPCARCFDLLCSFRLLKKSHHLCDEWLTNVGLCMVFPRIIKNKLQPLVASLIISTIYAMECSSALPSS